MISYAIEGHVKKPNFVHCLIIHIILLSSQALGQFDLADICYKYVADLQPAFEAARLRMHAAKCEYKIGSYADGDQKYVYFQILMRREFFHIFHGNLSVTEAAS